MEHSNGRITAYIHLEAVEENFRRMKANLKEGVQMVAVIKTDAYGHGAVRIAKLVEPYPYIWGFAVAAVSEGLELRAAGITKPILILGYTFEEDYEAMIQNGIRPAVFTERMAEAFVCSGGPHRQEGADPHRSRHRDVPHRLCRYGREHSDGEEDQRDGTSVNRRCIHTFCKGRRDR